MTPNPQTSTPSGRHVRPAPDDDPRPAARSWPVGLAAVVLLVVGVFAAGGVLARLDIPGTAWFDLDAERQGAATFSALLLLAAGASTVVAWATGAAGRAVLPVGVVLVLMAVDEYWAVHESVEESLGIDWQLLYLPVFAVAGICFLVALRQSWASPAFRTVWTAGALCWVVSQVLELLQWSGDVQRPGIYVAMMIPEELLEMVGTGAFLVAMTVLISDRQHPAAGAPARRP